MIQTLSLERKCATVVAVGVHQQQGLVDLVGAHERTDRITNLFRVPVAAAL